MRSRMLPGEQKLATLSRSLQAVPIAYMMCIHASVLENAMKTTLRRVRKIVFLPERPDMFSQLWGAS